MLNSKSYFLKHLAVFVSSITKCADKIEHYKNTGEMLNNTPAQYKKEFEWLKEVDSLALANAQLNLQKAYNNFFRSKSVGFPKFKSKKSRLFNFPCG